MTFKIKHFILYAIFALLAVACASYGTLTGGKKDITPPKIVESTPENMTTQFNGKKIQITFDEFIQLKDIQKQFVVSPPMKTAPNVVSKPKDVIVNFEEELLPNTTYTLHFGNSIVDYNESNPFKKYDFVFSTGDHIDSLSILGKVYNAFDHTLDKDGLFVMLYPNNHDSVPRKTLPAFIAKTDEKGWFKIDHIYADTFMIFALKDLNRNFLFDMPTEDVAFSDTLIIFDTTYFSLPDTMPRTKLNAKDTANFDTLDYYAGYTPQIELFSFKEDVKKQYLNSYSRPQKNQFNIIFELPTDSFEMELLEATPLSNRWLLKDNNLLNDTLNFWVTDTFLLQKDTLKLRIGYQKPDSAGNIYMQNDTIKLIVKQNPAAKRKKIIERWMPTRPTVKTSLAGSNVLDLNKKFFIESDQPVNFIDKTKMSFTRTEDTIKIPVKYSIEKDSFFHRRYYINFTYIPDTEYNLITDSATFMSIFDSPSDSTGFKFKTQRDDYYGLIKLNLKNTAGPTIVQLTTPKGDLVREKYTNSDGEVLFDYLAQGSYGIKLIYDRNGNSIWDTGNWGKLIQPERTLYYKGEINVRPNWDKEIIWELPVIK